MNYSLGSSMGAKLTIEQMQVLAEARGGSCLSTVYVNGSTKLRWRCAEGHEWEAVPNSVKNDGSWCPVCSRNLRRSTIEEMQALAQERKGVCLSTVYVNNGTKLRWRCVEGHEWDATPSKVENGCQRSPRCGIARRASTRSGTIEQMQVLAKRYGGQCLSTKYVGNHTKLRWRCSEGHEWEATPAYMKQRVQQGNWCLKCRRVGQRPAPA